MCVSECEFWINVSCGFAGLLNCTVVCVRGGLEDTVLKFGPPVVIGASGAVLFM